ncbi:transmembrane protein, putative (macronuclear) [Tetrahymena thermophila SB210]|uniref:Transmembrane protein, putative n=1 Tax=Tetrahymena thermophila (strain SB210) TaxID=312017 RepID=W7X7Z2_TETTS|nr:transmembrane protein, putative [Tetrahymena thermophila SB210]EWS72543.1 transmembrane protein, putative [Tetrahymena thermophila SB210]|eukprot:XP_012654923.1 transmembrane protein, putative [Tetrahymena thermophila SB210]
MVIYYILLETQAIQKQTLIIQTSFKYRSVFVTLHKVFLRNNYQASYQIRKAYIKKICMLQFTTALLILSFCQKIFNFQKKIMLILIFLLFLNTLLLGKRLQMNFKNLKKFIVFLIVEYLYVKTLLLMIFQKYYLLIYEYLTYFKYFKVEFNQHFILVKKRFCLCTFLLLKDLQKDLQFLVLFPLLFCVALFFNQKRVRKKNQKFRFNQQNI